MNKYKINSKRKRKKKNHMKFRSDLRKRGRYTVYTIRIVYIPLTLGQRHTFIRKTQYTHTMSECSSNKISNNNKQYIISKCIRSTERKKNGIVKQQIPGIRKKNENNVCVCIPSCTYIFFFFSLVFRRIYCSWSTKVITLNVVKIHMQDIFSIKTRKKNKLKNITSILNCMEQHI